MRMTHTDGLSAERVFGGEVRAARETRGWSQEELAVRLRKDAGIDLHQTAIARLEGGSRAIRLNEAAALAHMLNLDLRQFGGIRQLTDEESEQLVAQLAEVEAAEAKLRQEKVALEAKLADVSERHANIESVRRSMVNTLVNQQSLAE